MELKFNDEIVSSNLENLVNVGIEATFISKEQIAEVIKILELKDDSREELQAKRNSVVKIIGGLSHDYRMKDDYKTMDQYHNCMSGVAAVIDNLYYSVK